MVGYKLAHQTQASRVMYINSADVDDMHEHTTHFTYTFNILISADSYTVRSAALYTTAPAQKSQRWTQAHKIPI